jgi:LAO/AO transport system kinase
VGQDEVDIVKHAHTTVIVVTPGMGDDIQAIKAGILEAGDIFVINKSDKEGTTKTFQDLRAMIEMGAQRFEENGWMPPIVKTQAILDKGVTDLLEAIEKHATSLLSSDAGMNRRTRQDQVRNELVEMVKSRLAQEVMHLLTESGELEQAVQSVINGEKDPYTIVDDLVLHKLKRM